MFNRGARSADRLDRYPPATGLCVHLVSFSFMTQAQLSRSSLVDRCKEWRLRRSSSVLFSSKFLVVDALPR
ncbi:unnamed protein product [Sphagnum troendelagicum]|uniref:Uncharacterized protein n=1 Tax=Sphagnum troendelagicum TaxID=128251 RepID=A0ABP0UGT3_9BRYO